MKNKKAMEREKIRKIIFWSGTLLVAASLALFAHIFYPVIFEELRYAFSSKNESVGQIILDGESGHEDDYIVPADNNFSIIIPKIGANAPVVRDVDPLNESEYRRRLREGIAHAKGTKLPGEAGNTFLFAHSSDDFYIENEYNTVFYLLSKLEKGDEFFIVYEGDIYRYAVEETRKVAPESVEYLDAISEESTATLMTCWPPGTAAKRLVVVGFLKEISDNGEIKIDR
ncbi:MAG: sortase [Methanoculleus sp.]|jgi:sortase A|nr:sortase [Candidatus Moranbacteria bacterium]